MNPIQHPLPSGLGPRTTATETLSGIDLTGKTALITGGYSGIGLETTRALAAAGAAIVVPARRPAAARAALAGIGRVTVDEFDLADVASVERFAGRQLAAGVPLDLLIANAGVMAIPETRIGPDGWALSATLTGLDAFRAD